MRDGFILVRHIAGVAWYYEKAQNGKPTRMTNEFNIRLINFYKSNIRAHMQRDKLGVGWKVVPFHD